MDALSASLLSAFGWILLGLSAAGCLYLCATTLVTRRHLRSAPAVAPGAEAVTILKPLHGGEPRLFDNLATFLTQDHRGAVQLLCGVARAEDPAVATVADLRRAFPDARIDLVIDPTSHGANGKIGNLVNMSGAIAHPIVMLSDSDIAVAPDYLARVAAALRQPGVGAVSCAYAGRGDTGFWSRLAAAQIDFQFLPNLLFGTVTGMAQPCMGSTIALTRETLGRIGGFRAFADVLADDHAIGAAVNGLGLKVVVPPMLVNHAFTETSLRALCRHELRWGATVRDLARGGYLGSIIAYPLPFALLGAGVHPLAGLGLLAVSLATRFGMMAAISGVTGQRPIPPLLLPLRDLLGFFLFIASLFVRRVDWRGERLIITRQGRISADTETPT
jgi:ceramide glucosyltransferase